MGFLFFLTASAPLGMQKPRQHELSGFYACLEQNLLLTLVLVLAVQCTQRLR